MIEAGVERAVRAKYQILHRHLDERGIRLWAASEALSLGWGGATVVSKATGLARSTIGRGEEEIRSGTARKALLRVRRQGGGRKAVTETDTGVVKDLEERVAPATRGDPTSPLRWTSKSTYRLSNELKERGHAVSPRTVASLLYQQGYTLPSTRKTREGDFHPDRDEQFKHISDNVAEFQTRGLPVVSIDAKKKELVGNFKNSGQEWQPKGEPEKVNLYDFEDKGLGKAIPYGVYDLTRNEGWVNIGIDHDTAEFATESIRQWWNRMGYQVYPGAGELLITADGGGSNGTRLRLWKVSLQKLADTLGIRLTVCHFPPGTSKWNAIEHKMFCHITENWRGRPLVSYAVIVNLIGHTTTTTGLRIKARLDTRRYPTGKQVPQEEFDAVHLEKDASHGDWNYTVVPRNETDV